MELRVTSSAKETKPARADGALRLFVGAFLLALVIYAVAFSFIEHRRTAKGPWRVTFTNTFAGVPLLLINQPALGLTNVQLQFAGESVRNHPGTTLLFTEPRPVPYELPFGRCLFMDTTFLPGTVTFNLFGHEIELLPRVLILDHQEFAWKSGAEVLLPQLSNERGGLVH